MTANITDNITGIRNPYLSFESKKLSPGIPNEVLTSPALLFLFYRIEQILGIRAGYEALKNLNNHIEESCGFSFTKNPAAYECLLTSREEIYVLSKYLTINETYFFRESVHFKMIEQILPRLLKLNRPIEICSAACSIGCEPYSIAMLLENQKKNGLMFDYAIDAFDVNLESIKTAENACYTSNVLREHKTSWKHILDANLVFSKNEYLVSDDIKKRVNFFPHNIMRGLKKQYDIVFFRNALIYFTSRNRNDVVNILSSSLNTNGYLFLGISETSSISHPLLVSCYSCDAFYFQKTSSINNIQKIEPQQNTQTSAVKNTASVLKEKPIKKEKASVTQNLIQIKVDYQKMCRIMEIEEGKKNAQNALFLIDKNDASSLCGSDLAASALYFLNSHDLSNAKTIFTYLEKCSSDKIIDYLKGDFHFYNENTEEAEKYYHEAALKDKYFWTPLYRIASIVSEGNRTRYEYKIKKAIEGIHLSYEQDNDYECFLGGFSRDYFLRILEKKLLT